MAIRDLTRTELLDFLKENLQFLKLSSQSFDNGFSSEAKRLAVTIRVLLHDTTNSKSLLKQLGLKENMQFLNSSDPRDPNNVLKTHHGLVYVVLTSGEGWHFKAPLEEAANMPWKTNTYINFNNWWNEMVLMDTQGKEYSRGDLVKILANKEGGAHVDPKIDHDYSELKKANRSIYCSEIENNGQKEKTYAGEVELHSIRQIAFELITSIELLDEI